MMPSGLSKQKTDTPVVKAFSPCKDTKETNRPLPSTEPHTGKEEQTSIAVRISSPPELSKGSEEKMAGTNESRFHHTKFDLELQEKLKEISSRKGRGWSPNDLEIFKKPLCLISTEHVSKDGKEEKIILKSEQDVFEQIKQIDLPLVIVAVVGLYRTGKSYLMNCLAKSSQGGFALGNTMESKTTGIWVWCKMHPTQKNTVLVLLDTEGLGDIEKGDKNHDSSILTLATLLCNCLLYNMKGAFDSEALSKLTFVTEMAKNIRYRGQSSEDNQMLSLIMPDFVLCLRDLTLQMKIKERSLSPNEYLQKCLAAQEGKGANFNKSRECIRKFFHKQECFVFPLPGDTAVVQNLETLSFDAISDSFKEATNIFVSYIYDIRPKEMPGSKPINGHMFVTLADRYVTAIQHEAVPDVDVAFTAAAKIENAKIEKEALEIFEKQMEILLRPVSGKVLRRLYTKAQQAALEYLRQNAVHDLKAKCEDQAQRKMDALWDTIKEDNDTLVRQKCEDTLEHDSLKSSIEEKIMNKDYETPGGYRKFQRDVERLREGYTSILRDFDEKETLWTWLGFVKSKREADRKIVEADELLSEKEKDDERKRNQENIEKIIKEQQRAQQEALGKQKKDLENHFKKLSEDREKQIKEDHAKFEAFVKKRLDEETAKKELLERKNRERKNKWVGARLLNALLNDD